MSRTRFSLTALAFLTLAMLPGALAQAQKTKPSYTFTDLGGLTGLSWKQSQAAAINDTGQIVGFSLTAGGPRGSEGHPVIWTKDSTGIYVITDLNPIAGMHGVANGINSQGEVVGTLNDYTVANGFLIRPVSVNGRQVWYQDLNLDGHNDLMTNLGSVGPVSISDNTQMVTNNSVVQFDPVTGNEVVTPVPNGGYPSAINNNRQLTGFFGAGTQAALWQVDALGNQLSVVTLAPLPNYPGSVGNCIDALGQVAGQSYLHNSDGSSLSRATLWQNGAITPPTDLGSLTNDSSSDPAGINTVNEVLEIVGSDYGKFGLRAFLWKNGVMTDLNSQISASGVSLWYAVAINPQGQIVGVASVTVGKHNTETHGFLLTPK